MGFRIMKFHAVTHLADDILMFGVPTNVDTGSNESHHKLTKVAAKLTQKDPTSFEEQTSHRLDDMHILSLSLEELKGRPLFMYNKDFNGKAIHDVVPNLGNNNKTGGMKFEVTLDDDSDE